MIMLRNDQLVPSEKVHIAPEDRGYQFGDGIYEVMRVYHGVMFEWEAHLKRFQNSAAQLRLNIPLEAERLTELLKELIAENSLVDGSVYLQLTRGVAPRSHAFPEVSEPVLTASVREGSLPKELLEAGMSAITTPDIRWLRVNIKSLNLLGNVLAKQEAKDAEADEAILVRDGYVTEGSTCNVFGIKDGICYTHPANNLILDGITRQVVIRLLADGNIPLVQRAMTREEMLAMDEVFVTSTGHEICPVIRIDQYPVGSGAPGPVTLRLKAAFSQLIMQYA